MLTLFIKGLVRRPTRGQLESWTLIPWREAPRLLCLELTASSLGPQAQSSKFLGSELVSWLTINDSG